MKDDEKIYEAFKDLPEYISRRLKQELAYLKDYKCGKAEKYSLNELLELADAWIKVNNAIGRGLPNQFYDHLIRTMDSDMAKDAFKKWIFWYGHEGINFVKEKVNEIANELKMELDKRKDWDEEDFHKEYYLFRDESELEL